MNMPKPSGASQQSSHKWLTIDGFEYLCFNLARQIMSYDEPIPDYSTRDQSLLESALGSPQQTFDKKLLYSTLSKQAAILFYSLIKNHPFKNGNKRIAVISLLAFLSINNKWLNIEPVDLYRLARDTADTKPEQRENTLIKIEETIEQNTIKIDDHQEE